MRRAALLWGAFVFALAVSADTPPPKQPADRAAYKEGVNAATPADRVAKLRQFVKTYPQSRLVSRANEKILDILTSDLPANSREIRKQVSVMLKAGKNNYYVYDSIASTLAGGNTELPLAEKLSKKSLSLSPEKEFIASTRAEYQRAKMQPPPDAVLHQEYLQTHAAFEATLGRIYIKEGQTQSGEPLLKQALKDDPANPDATTALGELAASNGHEEEALHDLALARVAGGLNPKQQDLLVSIYKKQHSGSIDGFESYLDEQYAKAFPPPFEAGTSNAKAAGRAVLVELQTGSGCGPCAGADLALDGVLERYPRAEVTVILEHQHIPLPDPMANPSSVERARLYNITGTPTIEIDGQTGPPAGSERSGSKDAYQKLTAALDKELQTAPEAKLQVTAQRDGNQVICHVNTTSVKGNVKDLRLQIALVENRIRYSGENGVRFHPMVLRDLANGPEGLKVNAASSKDVTYTFDLAKITADLKTYLDSYEKANDRFGPVTFIERKSEIDPDNLSVVTFLQDSETKHVLQSAYVAVN